MAYHLTWAWFVMIANVSVFVLILLLFFKPNVDLPLVYKYSSSTTLTK